MPNSSRMKWPYPGENTDPWFDSFEDMVAQIDASVYASREDRQLMMAKGGVFTFDAVSDTLSWSSTLEVLSPIAGFRMDIAAATVALTDGQVLYVNLTRSPTTNVTTAALVANQVPSTDAAYGIAVRRGEDIYFRHGAVLSSGISKNIFTGEDGGPKALVWAGGRESHNSELVPLVAGAFAFNPTNYDPVTSIVFRAVAANGDVSLTNKVQLYNLTDSELVAEIDVTTTDIAKDEVTLVRGTGAGQIDDLEHVYEVRIVLGATPAGPSETIELYSAELRIL